LHFHLSRAYLKVFRLCMYFSIYLNTARRQNTAEHFKDFPVWLDGSTALVRAVFKFIVYRLTPSLKFWLH